MSARPRVDEREIPNPSKLLLASQHPRGRAGRMAKIKNRGIHILRHTFFSHLAMRGAPARAIQDRAGHADLKTPQRYMNVSPAAIEGAIRLLEQRAGGEIGEARLSEIAN